MNDSSPRKEDGEAHSHFCPQESDSSFRQPRATGYVEDQSFRAENNSTSVVDFHNETSLESLPACERNILDQELSLPSVNVAYSMLFRYATKTDLVIFAIGIACAAISGAIMPLMTVSSFKNSNAMSNISRLFLANLLARFRSFSRVPLTTIISDTKSTNLRSTLYISP